MAQDLRVVENDRINRHPVAVGQTIEVGDPVAFNASGLVVIGTALLTSYLGVAASAVTSSVAGDSIDVYDDPKAVIAVKADNAAEVVQAVVGSTFDLIVTGGVFLVNLGATTLNVVKVRTIGSFHDPLLDGSFPTMDDGALVLVEFAAHQLSA